MLSDNFSESAHFISGSEAAFSAFKPPFFEVNFYDKPFCSFWENKNTFKEENILKWDYFSDAKRVSLTMGIGRTSFLCIKLLNFPAKHPLNVT